MWCKHDGKKSHKYNNIVQNKAFIGTICDHNRGKFRFDLYLHPWILDS